MALRPTVRFEVFKRDGFACGYCGRRPPDVTLEVDHIVPRSEGGGDELENLLTSCFDCNRGKAARPLDQHVPVTDVAEQAELIREREAQLRAFHKAKREQAQRRDFQFTEVYAYWFEVWGENGELPGYYVPRENALRSYIEELGPDEVKEAMRIARDRFNWLSTNAVRYFIGVCRRKVAHQEGRVRTCSICGERLVLTPSEQEDEKPGDTWTTSPVG